MARKKTQRLLLPHPEQIPQETPRPKARRPSTSPSRPPEPPRPPLHLDPRIYGLQRPLSGESLAHLQLSPEGLARWKLRYLALSPTLTVADLTPEGQLAILRRRGYTDGEIRVSFPGLAHLVPPA